VKLILEGGAGGGKIVAEGPPEKIIHDQQATPDII
jgi:excinuclease UvrABC ATPase subunit